MKTKLLTILLIAYWVGLVYASLMPFNVQPPEEARQRMDSLIHNWPLGAQRYISKSDVLVNLVLYVPLGGLMVTRWTAAHRRRHEAVAAGAVFACAATSMSVETLQAWTSRTPAGTDIIFNTVSGAIGAGLGLAYGRAAWVLLRRRIRLRVARRPMTLVAGGLLAMLASDALDPYWPTLRLQIVYEYAKSSHWTVGAGLTEHPWHHWLILRVGLYAFVALVLGSASRRHGSSRWIRGGVGAVAFAAVAEIAKLFIMGRQTNIANVATSAVGATIGVLLGLLLARRMRSRPKTVARLAALAVLIYTVYLWWQPFTFTASPYMVREKIPHGAEWLPLYHYAMGARLEDIQLFLRTIILSGAMVFCVGLDWRMAPRYLPAALFPAVLGFILEAGQAYLPGRVPSTTDVFCFALGGVLGAWAYRRHRRQRRAWPVPRRSRHPHHRRHRVATRS